MRGRAAHVDPSNGVLSDLRGVTGGTADCQVGMTARLRLPPPARGFNWVSSMDTASHLLLKRSYARALPDGFQRRSHGVIDHLLEALERLLVLPVLTEEVVVIETCRQFVYLDDSNGDGGSV